MSAAPALGLVLLLPGCYDLAQGLDEMSDDRDGDGWSALDGDCDDHDREVSPTATEIAGDDVDSNCDGEDDT